MAVAFQPNLVETQAGGVHVETNSPLTNGITMFTPAGSLKDKAATTLVARATWMRARSWICSYRGLQAAQVNEMRRFIVLLLAGGYLAAADLPKREVFGAIGLGKHYDDEGSLGSGLNGGGGLDTGCRAGSEWKRRSTVSAPVASSVPRSRRFRRMGAHGDGQRPATLNQSAAAQAYVLFGAGLLHARE